MQKKILVVDDHAITRLGTALSVEALGFETEQAENGGEAFECMKASQYALVLMDFNMPDMTGAQCAEKIRELETGTGTRTPIVAMTASAEAETRRVCMRAGMDDFLDKSCDLEELKLAVLKWAVTAV